MASKKKPAEAATIARAGKECRECDDYADKLVRKSTELVRALGAEFGAASEDQLRGPEAIRLLQELRELRNQKSSL